MLSYLFEFIHFNFIKILIEKEQLSSMLVNKMIIFLLLIFVDSHYIFLLTLNELYCLLRIKKA